MKIEKEEKKRILEMHNKHKKPIDEGFFDDLMAGIKSIPQGFVYNRNLSKISGIIDKILNQSLKAEKYMQDLRRLKSELSNKNIDSLQRDHLSKAIDYIIQNHESNKNFLNSLRGKLKQKGQTPTAQPNPTNTNPQP
jgi:anionic cell wall polymer biosynthesis LytR-Cps2A-Psr (LCP) family protein